MTREPPSATPTPTPAPTPCPLAHTPPNPTRQRAVRRMRGSSAPSFPIALPYLPNLPTYLHTSLASSRLISPHALGLRKPPPTHPSQTLACPSSPHPRPHPQHTAAHARARAAADSLRSRVDRSARRVLLCGFSPLVLSPGPRPGLARPEGGKEGRAAGVKIDVPCRACFCVLGWAGLGGAGLGVTTYLLPDT